MRIGIDISQVVYHGGVSRHVRNLVLTLIKQDQNNTYVLFGATLRQRVHLENFLKEARRINPKVQTRVIPIPQTILQVLWNTLHILPIETFIGDVDVFWSSDWTTPPVRNALGVTTIHDLIVYRFPEQFDKAIVNAQKKRLYWAQREYQIFFCDSKATLHDALTYLHIDRPKLHLVYSGFN